MEITEDIHELIGHTPLIHLRHLNLPVQVNIYAKAELFNPGGSIKDRLGEFMLKKAEERGRIHEGSVIIEVTAGNTGIGLALAALNKGYHLILIVPECYAKEKKIIMQSLGAEMISVGCGINETDAKVRELLLEYPDAYFVNQFQNPDNPAAYYETLGPEIYEQTEGKTDYFVCGAGSGGTFSGTAKYLKEKNERIRAILADPEGSIIGGGQKGPFEIEGIGNYFVADTMNLSLVDKVIKVTDQEAFDACRLLAEKEGLLCGSSSGAALAAALKMVQEGVNGNIVIILPDRAERYFSEGLLQE